MNNIQIFSLIVLMVFFIPIFIIDFKYKILPNILTKPLIIIGLILNYFNIFVSLKESILGALFGYFFLWSIFWIYKLITGQEGLGYGDFKLLAAVGAWFGIAIILPVMLLASILGLVISLIINLFTRTNTIAFGPAIILATICVYFWGLNYVVMSQTGCIGIIFPNSHH